MIERSHVVTRYRATLVTGTGGQRTRSWVAQSTGIECNIQPRSGSLRASAAGTEVVGEFACFMPPTEEALEDDLIVVTDGVGPDQYRVVFVGHHGPGWDLELDLERSEESLS